MQHATIVLSMDEPTPSAPRSIGDAADDNLQFIRRMMALSREFAGISGRAMMLSGAAALVGSGLATRQSDRAHWLAVWLGLALLCALGGFIAMAAKSRRIGQGLAQGVGRRFLLQFAAPMLAGVALTTLFVRQGLIAHLPALWLLCYGSAIVAAGAFSVRLVPLMGLLFLVLGLAACVLPDARLPLPGTVHLSDLLLATGFGLGHIVFGALLSRRLGG